MLWYDKYWHVDIKRIIAEQQLREIPISKKKAETVNKFLLEKEGSNGVVCKLIDYLKHYDADKIGHEPDAPCIAMNIGVLVDHITWARYETVPDRDTQVSSTTARTTGYYGTIFGIPIVVSKEIKTNIH